VKTAVHSNSLATFRAEEHRFSRRAVAVREWIREHGPHTDRQVMQGMGFREPNAVRPRITELVDAGELIEVRNTRCPETGKTVRVVDVPRRGQMELLS
jgi:hypothetical protein